MIAKFTGAVSALWLLMPIGACALGAQIDHLDGNHYRVHAWTSGNLGTTAQLQEVSETHQTMDFQLVVTNNPHYFGRTVGWPSSTIDVTVPVDVEEVCVRCGNESVLLDLQKHSSDSATAQVIQHAIDHGDVLEFSYSNVKVVARPRLLYRVSGDTHGQIVQCIAQAKGDSKGTRCFYIRSISDVTVKDTNRLNRL
ncbi:MAG: hypothetical protein P4L53_15115 [Candidatus Obscuribacterales bacterium]|nr:hypothetical protein [Candidatus Obscuribacterales bacterium]